MLDLFCFKKSIAIARELIYACPMSAKDSLANVYIIILLTAAVFVNVLVYAKLTRDEDGQWRMPALFTNTQKSESRNIVTASGGKMGPDLYEYSYALPVSESKYRRYSNRATKRRSYNRPYISRTYERRTEGINPFYEDADRWRVVKDY